MRDLDMQFKVKEHEIDRQVGERMLNLETTRLNWLKEEQLKEKTEIFDKYLPIDSIMRDFTTSLLAEEQKELDDFKRDQEIERQRRLAELQA